MSGDAAPTTPGRPFGSVLVANRGEIAVRVLRAARSAGLRGVAVYSDADRSALHVREAEDAVWIGPTPALESYLSIPALIGAARRAGAEAVHPGYGFLAENADFARACAEAGLVWVGPAPDVIERMGRKDEARAIAEAAHVPVVPALPDMGDAELADAAGREVGFPLMVKAVAGGGGKGMRIVREQSELLEALRAARREARAAFGDDRVLVERLLERARHVEVQVFGDLHGNVVHMFERDCSVQRRHQKVVEEAPAPTVGGRLRAALGEAGSRLAREVGYAGAGTVEFMVVGDDFYFLEMNARLQVEHPVTELVTGLDLVTLQLRVAAGEPLPFRQQDLRLDGHAIEARVYAEDAERGFLPQAGTVSRTRWSPRARVDAALLDGQDVTTAYDPMLGKLIVRGADRAAARRSLLAALDDSVVFGVTTNLGFLRRLVASDEFAGATIDTGWLDRHPGAFGARPAPEALWAAAWHRATSAPPRSRSTGGSGDAPGPFSAGDGWRLGGPPAPVRVELLLQGRRHHLTVDPLGGQVGDGDRRVAVRPIAVEAGRLVLEIDGSAQTFHIDERAEELRVGYRGEVHAFEDPELVPEATHGELADGCLTAPMPGTVVAVTAEPGRVVGGGETLLVMEAMKMELAISAPFDGTVARVNVAAGDQVPVGHLLVEVASDDRG